MEMSKDSSTKYKKKNKEKRNFVKDIKIILKKRKTKSENMVVINIKISQKTKAS